MALSWYVKQFPVFAGTCEVCQGRVHSFTGPLPTAEGEKDLLLCWCKQCEKILGSYWRGTVQTWQQRVEEEGSTITTGTQAPGSVHAPVATKNPHPWNETAAGNYLRKASKVTVCPTCHFPTTKEGVCQTCAQVATAQNPT